MIETIKNKVAGFVAGVKEKFNRGCAAVVVGSTLALAPAANAQSSGSGIDLSAVTTGVTDTKTAVIGIAGAVIGAGLALGAIKFGGKWAYRLFKSFSS